MKLSQSAYAAWAAGKTYQLSERKKVLTQKVKACFERHRRRYGTRRIAAELADEGVKTGRQEIRTAMKRENLVAIQPKRFVPKTTDSAHGKLASPNLLGMAENQPTAPAEVVIGDITYLPLSNGAWCYLAVWQDKFMRRIIGWAVEAQMTAELVIKAFNKATRRGLIKANAIVHTDQGSPYVSNDFRARLSDHKLRQSMSRRGNCLR